MKRPRGAEGRANRQGAPTRLFVVSEAMGEFAAGLEDQRRQFGNDALGGDPVTWTGHSERADDGTRVITNRHGDRRHVLEEFSRIDRVALANNRMKLLEELRAV